MFLQIENLDGNTYCTDNNCTDSLRENFSPRVTELVYLISLIPHLAPRFLSTKLANSVTRFILFHSIDK